jgi:hypothetical protein
LPEFDCFLEEHKEFMTGGLDNINRDTESDHQSYLGDDDIERADQQVI